MAYQFDIHPESLKRNFSVYVVVVKGECETLLYVGKTGDNREGCNPLISRCGNHFSYNRIHSQVRNKVELHENWRYTYIFDHFDAYCDDPHERRTRIDRINEMERWLNSKIQNLLLDRQGVRHLNPYHATGYCGNAEKQKRASFRTADAEDRLNGIVQLVDQLLPHAAHESA